MAPVEPALDTCQVYPSGFREEINSRLPALICRLEIKPESETTIANRFRYF